jgi:hypothetical protein
MGITLRIVTGSTLTYGQVDTNFSSLYYSASQSGNNLVLHTTGSFVQAATTTTFNLGLGYNTIATGIYSHAEGDQTIASGQGSHAEGLFTFASGSYSHAEGMNTTASGANSHAEGQNTLASDTAAHAEGNYTTASGPYSHAEGYQTNAAFWGSHTEGTGTRTTNYYAHAEGLSTLASGGSSHAEGHSVTASGDYSHAEGLTNKSLGPWSHAEGQSTIASGTGSHAEGFYTTALGDFQHVQGQYNISSPFQSAFILGNGTSDGSRSNLIYASGSEVQISGSLTVGSGSSTVAPTYGFTPNLAIGMPTGSTGAVLDLSNTRGIIVGGDTLGILQFSGLASGTSYASSQIRATVNSSAGSGDPGGGILSFWTGNDYGGASPEERMRITHQGKVGIGTTGPSHPLDVNGVAVFRSDLYMTAGGGSAVPDWYFAINGAGDLVIDDAVGSKNFIFSNSGRVGIGTTTPNAKLDVNGSTIITGSLTVTNGITGSFKGDGSQITGVTAEWDGSHNGNASITGSLTVTGDITGSGNLLLSKTGTRVLTMEAQVAGGTELRLLPNNAGGHARINVGNTNAPLDFQMNSVDVMRITQAGNILIGTTADTGDILRVQGNTSISGIAKVTGSLIVTDKLSNGNAVSALGGYSHAEGGYTKATNYYAHAEGYSTKAGTDKAYLATSFNEGIIELSSIYGNVTSSFPSGDLFFYDDNPYDGDLGEINEFISDSQYSGGVTTIELAGDWTSYYGNNGIVGNLSKPLRTWNGNMNYRGEWSHAEGYSSISYGVGSHAEGYSTEAQGYHSHAEGYYTQAIGPFSHAEGQNTKTAGDYQHVQGKYNITSSISAAFILGNGTSDISRSNLIFAAGNTVQITGSLTVTNGITGSFKGDGSQITGVTAEWDGSHNGNASITGSLITSGTLLVGGTIVPGTPTFGSTPDVVVGESTGGVLDIRNTTTTGIAPGDTLGIIQFSAKSDTTVGYASSQIRATVSQSPGVGWAGGGILSFWTGQASLGASPVERMRINQSGNVGIGTTDPGSYKLNVNGNTTIIGSFSNGNAVNASGSYSHAEGSGTIASGSFSHAEGTGSIATGEYSHAEGYFTNAAFYGSHAEGAVTRTTNYYAHAEGLNTLASGNSSHAEGNSTTASGDYSHAEGGGSEALGLWSHAEGAYGKTVGPYSHAEGERTVAFGTSSHAEGIHTSASGNYSHAEGTGSIASGEYSHAEGYKTHAAFYGSHTEGVDTRTTNYYAHAEGFNTLASGGSAHAEGHSVTASGDFAHAEGITTKAIGPFSHAEGHSTISSGTGSHAEGYYTVASGSYQHVQGQFNISSSVQSAFIHGNGTSDSSRSNLIYAAGNTVEITGSLMLNDILVLAPRTTTPTPSAGMVIVSGSGVDQHIYCYLNSTWKQLD